MTLDEIKKKKEEFKKYSDDSNMNDEMYNDKTDESLNNNPFS